MKNRLHHIVGNQRGSVINVALLILILIFLVGIGLNKISTTDIKITNNMKTDTITFYEAEAALDSASELLEKNIACTTGFTDTPTGTDGIPAGQEIIEGRIRVNNLTFWRNQSAGSPAGDPTDPVTFPDIVAYYPPDYDPAVDPDEPHTNLAIGGATRISRGAAIQMAAGYEGLGKGSAGGGTNIIYDVYALRFGNQNSSSMHYIQWIHKLGLGGSCSY